MTRTFWQEVLALVRDRMNPADQAILNRIAPGELANGELAIHVGDRPDWQLLQERYTPAFVAAAQDATGRLVAVRFIHTSDLIARPAPAPSEPAAPYQDPHGDLKLVVDNTFDNFVVGPNNRLAHAAAVAVCESLGKAYNPLFVHGDAGLGKTHLLQATCWSVRKRWPEASILYLSCEEFINHFLEAVETGMLHNFRYRYRHMDLLVIDDIQFLAKHEQTQEEFFHTFNTLYQAQKQIVLSADLPPSRLSSLEDRLISRFNWGLVARMDKPSFETRMAILRKKARLRGVTLPEDVVTLIAGSVDSNIRALEGAINTLQGLSAATQAPIDLAMAKQILGEAAPPPQETSMQQVLDAVTRRFSVKLSDLQGKKRTHSIALPRQVCMYLIYKHTRHSLKEIGGYFGGRDHTTVLHACRTIEQQIQLDGAFAGLVQDLERELKP